MSDWELLDFDPATGLKKFIAAGDDPDSVQVRYESDAEPILERNKALQNEDFDRRSDMWHVASIPIGVMYEWLTKHGVNCWNPNHIDGVKRLLNSNEYRWLKVKDVFL